MRLRELFPAPALAPEERSVAGRVSGMLYAVGGLTLWSLVLLPGVANPNRPAIVAIAAFATLWGAVCMLIVDWTRPLERVVEITTLLALVLIAAAVAASGGGRSVAWIYLFFETGFVSYFYRRRVAGAYLLACVAVQALPAVYDHTAGSELYLPSLVIAGPGYIALGVAIMSGKSTLQRMRARAESLAAEQAALLRITMAVAAGLDADRVYATVSEELGRLLGAGAAGVLRVESAGELRVMGSWSAPGRERYPHGTIVPARAGGDLELALRDRRPVRVDQHLVGSPALERLGYACTVITPVEAEGRLWGILALAHPEPGGLPATCEERTVTFGRLVASAISHTEDRARLAEQASTDPLTGLVNHRTLHERLGVELIRARRHGRPLSVALLDIDNFKRINDVAGHGSGDWVIREVAARLRTMARAEDILGRLGGDEFAWVLPECDRGQALVALERARQAIAGDPLLGTRITVSVGLCDTDFAEEGQALLSLADGALYWAKAHGRDCCWVYDPQVIRELSAQERADHLERSQALVGLRALARAIDAKDPTTRRHSERVAELAIRLATTVGWPEERARQLAEAALVHDVGKIGIPDAVLLKEGRLTPAEYEQIKGHAELGARITGEVLSDEQVQWILAHHERPDGLGYPRGLSGEEIPDGAALLAVADAWDVMTRSRPYSLPKPMEEALEECQRLVGRQFSAPAVQALLRLASAGELAELLETQPA